MKVFIWSIIAIMLLGVVACGSGSQVQSSPSPSRVPSVETTEIQTVTPVAEEVPSEGNNPQVRAIYQKLPKPLPAGPDFKIEYQDSSPKFIVTAIDPSGVEDFHQTIEQAANWFRELGYDPCQPPLAGAVFFTATRFPRSDTPPSPEQVPWEPCDANAK